MPSRCIRRQPWRQPRSSSFTSAWLTSQGELSIDGIGRPLRPVATSVGRRAGSAGEASEQDESLALVGGPPTMNELGELTALARVNSFASAVRTTTRRSGGKSFRDAYMALLADGAADELDALRCEQPPMTEAELRTLLDALESGCASFGGTERALLMATFVGKRSWWEQRASEARRPAAASAAKTKMAARKRRGAAPESGDKWGDMSSSEDEGATTYGERCASAACAPRSAALPSKAAIDDAFCVSISDVWAPAPRQRGCGSINTFVCRSIPQSPVPTHAAPGLIR